MRRLLDVALASVLLVIAAPVLLVCMTVVYLDGGRPIFFGHERVGRRGKRFRCWKLRTMHVGAERAVGGESELAHRYRRNGYKLPSDEDPRVTRVGRWLRRSYLDEIPQLFNVLNGTMALVGPRPVVAEELAEFAPHAEEILAARPGVFGAWTARGWRRPAYPERVRVELEYVRNRSLARDVAILIRSIPVVLRGERN